MLQETSVASTKLRALPPVARMVPVADPEARHEQAVRLGSRLLLERRVGRDRPGAQGRDRGHDLEHRAGHVQPLGRPGQEGLGGIGSQGIEHRHRGRRVGDRRGVVDGRGGEDEDLAVAGVQHDHRPGIAAEGRNGRLLEGGHERRPHRLGIGGVLAELAEEVLDGIGRGYPAQLGVVGALEAGRPVLARGVADDRPRSIARGRSGRARRSRRRGSRPGARRRGR